MAPKKGAPPTRAGNGAVATAAVDVATAAAATDDEPSRQKKEQNEAEEQQQQQQQQRRARSSARARTLVEIARLERLVALRRADVERLSAAHAALHASAHAAQVETAQTLAMLHLGAALEARRHEQQRQAYAAAGAAATGPSVTGAGWRAHLHDMVRALREQLGPDVAASPSALGALGNAAGGACLGWDPSEAAAAAAADGADLSVTGLRAAVREFVVSAGPLHAKLRSGSGCPPDVAAAACDELYRCRAKVLGFSAAVCLAADPSAPSQVLLTPMDDPAPHQPQQPPGPEWSEWLVDQLALSEAQEATIAAVLASLERTTSANEAQRRTLLGECARIGEGISGGHGGSNDGAEGGAAGAAAAAAGGGGGGPLAAAALAAACYDPAAEVSDRLARVSAALRTYQALAGVAMLAVYGTLLRADQFAAYMLCAWPWLPSLSGLRVVLKRRREARRRRQQQQQQQQQAEGMEPAFNDAAAVNTCCLEVAQLSSGGGGGAGSASPGDTKAAATSIG